jgi:copper chaperone CopZ
VRSALASVKGVTRADVSFEAHEARVDYDPRQCSIQALIAAVAAVKDPNMPAGFRAALRK